MTALRTVLVGAGKIGLGYGADPVMAKHYPYATHAQVLRDHPAFALGAVVDRSDEALRLAREDYAVAITSNRVEDCIAWAPEVAVLATPPSERLGFVAALPSLRAVLVEKPLGRDEKEAQRFLDECTAKGILVQVNLWRRADRVFRELAHDLERRIGRVQGGFALYGNGLHNNGTHVVDFLRMLLGEIVSVQATGPAGPAHGPIPGDVHVPFVLRFASGVIVQASPLDFREYRENGIDLWGTEGRLTILQEGLTIAVAPRRENRAMSGEREIASDAADLLAPSVGRAFYEMYDDLARALREGTPLCSPATSAMRSTAIVDAIERSANEGGRSVECSAPAR
jgi:predicted dehydrogenase